MTQKLLFTCVLSIGMHTVIKAQLAAKFPPETMTYKPIGKPDCSSMNVAGMPPMNTCSQKYTNGKLTIEIALTEYPKGNPILSIAGDGDDVGLDKNDYTIENITVGNAKGKVTYMKKTHIATVSMQVSDKLIVDVNGANQPNAEAVKALAKGLKL
jgi:hypothetical protein